MSEKLIAIREKCIQANPEIVELKFGCEIQIHDEDFSVLTVLARVMFCKKHKKVRDSCYEDCPTEDGVWAFHNDEENPYEMNVPDSFKYEILGRPIRFADVLLAKRQSHGSFRYDIDAVERMNWNLRADDLEKQSDETINFLCELLT